MDITINDNTFTYKGYDIEITAIVSGGYIPDDPVLDLYISNKNHAKGLDTTLREHGYYKIAEAMNSVSTIQQAFEFVDQLAALQLY